MGCSAPCPGPEHTCDGREACPGLEWDLNPDLAPFKLLVPPWEAGQVDSRLLNGWEGGGLTGVLALSQGLLTNPKSSLLVQGGAACC